VIREKIDNFEDVSDSESKPSANSGRYSRHKSFYDELIRFKEKTESHAVQGPTPGGYYTGLWCRDSSYILKDWFLSGRIHEVLEQIHVIWSHQLDPNNGDKIVFGRGSPEMNFEPTIAEEKVKKRFQGSLPTSIFHHRKICEVFGRAPDIDSTALMISTTAWILTGLWSKKSFDTSSTQFTTHNHVDKLQNVIDFVIPRIVKAIEYLSKRDIDNDGLLEQSHNEDWMDSVLRAGKIVYSQACWILALSNFSVFLQVQSSKHTSLIESMVKMIDNTIRAIEQKLWSEADGSYIDIQVTHHIGGPYRTLSQDISLYLVALTENTKLDSLSINDHIQKRNLVLPRIVKLMNEKGDNKTRINDRLLSTLEAIRSRSRSKKWPLVTEVELNSTGPWYLRPNEYHNHTFWPWATGIEMLARSRLGQFKECKILLSTLAAKGHPHLHCYYEWLNPLNDRSGGVYPFRTGISAVRIALTDLIEKIEDRVFLDGRIATENKT
jgi:hypothetical protein